jgi:hypothetical protein
MVYGTRPPNMLSLACKIVGGIPGFDSSCPKVPLSPHFSLSLFWNRNLPLVNKERRLNCVIRLKIFGVSCNCVHWTLLNNPTGMLHTTKLKVQPSEVCNCMRNRTCTPPLVLQRNINLQWCWRPTGVRLPVSEYSGIWYFFFWPCPPCRVILPTYLPTQLAEPPTCERVKRFNGESHNINGV